MKKPISQILFILLILMILFIFYNLTLSYCNKDWIKFSNALDNNDHNTIHSMINNGYDINEAFFPSHKNNHLALAVANRGIISDTIKILLENGANPNFKANGKVPLLLLSAAFKQPQKTKLLLAYGADTQSTISDKTITDIALLTKQPEIIMMIPEEQISSGIFLTMNPELVERVLQYYYNGETDDRILNYWEKHHHFSKTLLNYLRKSKK